MTMKENKIPTIKHLRQNGWKVKLHHQRLVRRFMNDGMPKIKDELMPISMARDLCRNDKLHNVILSKGGQTTAYVTKPDGSYYEATVYCNSDTDNFCYKDSHNYCFEAMMNQGLKFE